MFNKKTLIVSLVVIIIIAAFYGQQIYRFIKPVEMASTTIKRGPIQEKLVLSGSIEAEEHAELSFQTGGLLSWVGVKEGDSVRKYQAIASLDQRELKKKLDKALKDYLEKRWDFEQTKEDYPYDLVSPEFRRIVDKAQFTLDKSVLDVEIQDLAIKLSTITTPIAGVVTKVVTPYAGVNVRAGTTLFEIVNPQTFYMEASADQTEVVNLQKGQKASVILDSYPEETLNCEIGSISLTPKEDETGTVYKVKISCPDFQTGKHDYRVGMTADVEIITRQKDNVLYVPVSFVRSDDQGSYVIKGEEKKKIYVQTGLESDEFVEVSGDIKEGDVIYQEI